MGVTKCNVVQMQSWMNDDWGGDYILLSLYLAMATPALL